MLLQQQLLLDEATLFSLTAHPLAFLLDDAPPSTSDGSFLLRQQLFSTFFLNYPHTRVCPRCLAEDPVYDRLYWRMKSVFFCPLHHMRLRECCPRCAQRISALRPQPFRCPSCQQGDYREPISPSIDQNHLLQRSTDLFLCASLGIPFPTERTPQQQVCPLFPHQASRTAIALLQQMKRELKEAFSREELLALLVALGDLSEEDVVAHAEVFPTADMAAFFLYHALLLEWPTRCLRLLDLLYALAAPPFVGHTPTAVVDDCRHLFSHPWFKPVYQKHLQSYRCDQETIVTTQIHMKAILKNVVSAEQSQAIRHHREPLFLEEQRSGSLLSCVSPFPWENLPSFIARAACQMGPYHPQQLLHPAGTFLSLNESGLLLLEGKAQYTLLAYVLQTDSQTIYGMTLHRFADLFQRWGIYPVSETYPPLDITVSLWLFPDRQHIKVCPRCLEEEAYDRLYWMARVLVICPYHYIPFPSVCPSCS